MALSEIWKESPEQIKEKSISQIIAFSGTGQLKDGSNTSQELRELLSIVPSLLLMRYTDECLQKGFTDSGLALQDIVNQIGRRLGFKVQDGRYRGVKNEIGFDGLWQSPDGDSIVVEVKTTDAYRMTLDSIAGYREALIQAGQIVEKNSSILLVVGREDTGDLEAQIRGSKHAWDIRLISIDALLKLMNLKESIEDPQIIKKVYKTLMPAEYTKVDGIIDLVFSTAEDVMQEEEGDNESNRSESDSKKAFIPVKFYDACISNLEKYFKQSFVRFSRAKYYYENGKAGLLCIISKTYVRGTRDKYWFAFHPHQKDFLESLESDSHVVLGCGGPSNLIVVPFDIFSTWLGGMNVTEKENRFYWHVHVFEKAGKLELVRKSGKSRIDLTPYKMKL